VFDPSDGRTLIVLHDADNLDRRPFGVASGSLEDGVSRSHARADLAARAVGVTAIAAPGNGLNGTEFSRSSAYGYVTQPFVIDALPGFHPDGVGLASVTLSVRGFITAGVPPAEDQPATINVFGQLNVTSRADADAPSDFVRSSASIYLFDQGGASFDNNFFGSGSVSRESVIAFRFLPGEESMFTLTLSAFAMSGGGAEFGHTADIAFALPPGYAVTFITRSRPLPPPPRAVPIPASVTVFGLGCAALLCAVARRRTAVAA
jgi:hypothetical protein